MQAYKILEPDMACLGYQYKLGKTHVYDGKISMCKAGFHACRKLQDCFYYYSPLVNRIFRVDMGGETIHGPDKSVCSEITILEELTWEDAFKQCSSLESLDLDNTQVSDVSPLAACTALERLYLNNTPVSDLSPLAACTALKSLYLVNTPVSDVSPLAACKSLEWLDLDKTPVAEEQVEMLHEALSNCVIWR